MKPSQIQQENGATDLRGRRYETNGLNEQTDSMQTIQIQKCPVPVQGSSCGLFVEEQRAAFLASLAIAIAAGEWLAMLPAAANATFATGAATIQAALCPSWTGQAFLPPHSHRLQMTPNERHPPIASLQMHHFQGEEHWPEPCSFPAEPDGSYS